MSRLEEATSAAAADESLRFEGVGLAYRGDRVLSGIDLSIGAGLTTLLGPSGCGKSTLLRLAAGLLEPSEGRMSRAANLRLGYVFQDAHLLPWRQVLGNAALPLELLGKDSDFCRQSAMKALAAVGLEGAASLYPNQLSGGMRMRVSLARALVTEPNLLLMDEPFAALDEPTRQNLQEGLLELTGSGKLTVLFVTHSVAEAAFLSERVILLSARPAKVKADIRVELPGPRTHETRTSPEYNRVIRELDEALRKG